LQGHSDAIQSIAFSPNGKVLLSGGYDGLVKLWLVSKWSEVAEFQYDQRIHAVRCMPAGDNRLGLLVGSREEHNDPAKLQVHWVNTASTADWNWLNAGVQNRPY